MMSAGAGLGGGLGLGLGGGSGGSTRPSSAATTTSSGNGGGNGSASVAAPPPLAAVGEEEEGPEDGNEEVLENARATVELLRVAGAMLRTNLDGVRKLLVPESGEEEEEGEDGMEAMDRLGLALNDLLLPPTTASFSQPAAAAAAQGMALATPPRALSAAGSIPSPAAAAAAAAAPASGGGGNGGRRASVASSSRFSAASSLGMSAGGNGKAGRVSGVGSSSGGSSGSSGSRRSSLLLSKALVGAAGGSAAGEEGTAATMDVSGGSCYSDAGSGSVAGASMRRTSSLLLQLCRDAGGDPVAAALHDGALLHEIFSYLVPPSLAARPLLGDLALVHPIWRAAAASDAFWLPVSCALFPALPPAVPGAGALPDPGMGGGENEEDTPPSSPSEAGSGSQAGGGGGGKDGPVWQARRSRCKEQVLAVGRALGTPGFRKTSQWQEGLSMIYEVVDEKDGKRLFYGAGPLHVATGQNTILRLTGTNRKELSEPFSAAERDPGHERFGSVREWFKTMHNPHYPTSLRIRVLVCDDATGKVALLYQSGKATKRHAKTPNASYWQDFLPDEGALYLWDSDQVVYGKGETQAKLAAAFYCVPADEEDDDVPEKLKMYKIAGGDVDRYGVHSSYVSLDFSTSDSEGVAKFVKGLLA